LVLFSFVWTFENQLGFQIRSYSPTRSRTHPRLARDRNSSRDALFLRNEPSVALVMVEERCFSTPRIIMQKWLASHNTATPRGRNNFRHRLGDFVSQPFLRPAIVGRTCSQCEGSLNRARFEYQVSFVPCPRDAHLRRAGVKYFGHPPSLATRQRRPCRLEVEWACIPLPSYQYLLRQTKNSAIQLRRVQAIVRIQLLRTSLRWTAVSKPASRRV